MNDIIGEKRIDLSYPIKGKEIAVVSMLSDNVQYWLQGSIEVLLKMSKKIVLNKGVYTEVSGQNPPDKIPWTKSPRQNPPGQNAP